MTDPKDDMPAWATKIGEKLDKLFPEESDEPEWVKNLLTKLDSLAGNDAGDNADEPAWVKGLMDKLDKVGGEPAASGSQRPNAPKRRTPRTPAAPTDAKPKSRWFNVQ